MLRQALNSYFFLGILSSLMAAVYANPAMITADCFRSSSMIGPSKTI